MIFELIIAIVITTFLRKSLQTKVLYKSLDKEFTFILYAAIALMAIGIFFEHWDFVTKWVSHLLMLILVYILFTRKDIGKVRAILYAIAPYIILSLFSDIARITAETQYSAWKGILDAGLSFSFVWMIVMWVIATRQNKALEKEKRKAKEEEQQKKLMETMKDQLEVQVAERTSELRKQKEELQHALEELKSTQSQLIQSEKMASLGELTAGIAHEIQNPLNFVNNFSEVNQDLIGELNAERSKPKGERDEQLENEIIRDIKENSEKINHHGKRADAIVKGMLQHSRKNTGQREPTDINALCDEYLRLSYHGLRAKDKSFNANFKTDFDESLSANPSGAGKINVVPQDMGRVLLNLINNAFYAVSERQNAERSKQNAGSYEPTVIVSTKKVGDKIRISVMDNGSGIPEKIKDKIFQPFFTTKPTGQGTGLGLSMSYDIVKAHGGELKVKTQYEEPAHAGKENRFTEFIITLPILEK